jgi:Mrp family chromosome partitioning ATPase
MVTDTQSGAQVVLGSQHNDRATDQLLSGRTFARLLDAAREKFDIVILDTPPVGPVVDGLLLAGKADAVVFVVKWSATPQQQVRSALAALTAATGDKVPLLAVINQRRRDLIAYGDTYVKYYAET